MEHVVSQLISKRAELSGELNHLLEKIEHLKEAINAIDISIKVFDPDFKTESIKDKKFRKNSQLFKHGESQKLVLDVLRRSKSPLCIREIAIEVMKLKNLDYENPELCLDIEKRLRGNIDKNQMLRTIKEEGELMRWEIAS